MPWIEAWLSVMLDVLTWHVHGSYLLSLAHTPVRWFLPVAPGRSGYGGRTRGFPWPANVVEIPVAEVARRTFDVVVYQHHEHYEIDRWEVLGERQRRRPGRVHRARSAPRGVPTDTVHPVEDGETLVVHVTHFNQLMWDTRNPSTVIEHGVALPRRRGSLARHAGIAVINNLPLRGRRLGLDVFDRARRRVPLELIGMDAEQLGGITRWRPPTFTAIVGEHRFVFSPIRYTSLGLGILEAMAAGVPVVGLTTTELATVGAAMATTASWTPTSTRSSPGRPDCCRDHALAHRLGGNARTLVRRRLGFNHFAHDWAQVLHERAASLGGLLRPRRSRVDAAGVAPSEKRSRVTGGRCGPTDRSVPLHAPKRSSATGTAP